MCLLLLCRQVWWRGVNDRKREVEEKAKQLEQVASLSALIAGFALVAMVEVNIPSVFLCVSVCLCVFVSVYLCVSVRVRSRAVRAVPQVYHVVGACMDRDKET